MPSSHLILCRSLLLLPPIPPSIRVFSNESTLHMRWPNYRSLRFNISSSNEHPRLVSFKMNWLDLLAVSRVFSRTAVQKHQFFGSQLSSQSNSHIHTWPLGKTIALTRWTFVGKVMSLLFNTVSRFVINFEIFEYALKYLNIFIKIKIPRDVYCGIQIISSLSYRLQE